MARDLLRQHGLDDWELGFDRAKRRAGCCHFDLKVISLSIPLTVLHPQDEVRDTVLHEIAHALVGPDHGHDDVWRAQAVEIGAAPERSLSDDLPKLPGKFTGTCPEGHQAERHRRPTKPASCPTCSSRFDAEKLFTWTMGDLSIRMLPTYVAALVRLVETTGSAVAEEQLEMDEALGGGRHQKAVIARQQQIRPGTQVRLSSAAGKYAGREGVVIRWLRTRYEVQCGETVLQVPPALVVARPDRA
nr:SprT-like domain-containing protein [Kineosporia mesophila]